MAEEKQRDSGRAINEWAYSYEWRWAQRVVWLLLFFIFVTAEN
jgi:hypothetical protein